LLGLIVFVALQIAYTTVYRPLGVEPGEVGLTYADTLERAAVGLVLLFVIWVAFLAIYVITTLAMDLLIGAVLRLRARAGRKPLNWKIGSELIGDTASYAIVISAALLFALLPYTSSQLSQDVRDGKALRPGAFDWGNPLGLRAQSAEVERLTDASDSQIPSRRLLYLGQADGVSVLFEPSSDEVVRVPSGSVVIRLLPDP
jgi:hypothetical protein